MRAPSVITRIFSISLSLLITSSSFAASNANSAAWQFKIAPYAWGISMNGTQQFGMRRVHVDESFSNILQHLDYAGMLWLEADKENFGLFFNAVTATLSDDAVDGPLTADARSHYGLFSAGASYRIYQANGWNISPYVGLRYTHNINSLSAQLPMMNFYFKDNQHWIDPIIGARFIYTMNHAWSFTFAGDLGGTNTASHFSYNLIGLLGYIPQSLSTHPTIYLGYRLLNQTYLSGSGPSTYLWDMKLAGPLLGIEFTF